MKILVVEDDKDIQQIIAFILESDFSASVVTANSGNEAIAILKADPDFNVIVCDHSMQDGNGASVFKHMNAEGSKVPFILCSTHHPSTLQYFHDFPPAGFVEKPDLFPALQDLINKVTKPTAPSDATASEEEIYYRMRPKLLLKLGPIACDLFIKIGPVTSKYVKAFHQNETLDEKDYLWFQGKQIDYFYIHANDASLVFKKLKDRISELMEKEPYHVDRAIELSGYHLELVAGLNHSFGFSAEVQELTRASVNAIIKSIREHPTLASLFSKVLIEPDRYLPSHSIALAYLSCGITSLMGWNTDATYSILTTAAFFHDIAIENDELAKIRSLTELESVKANFTPAELNLFSLHPSQGAKSAELLPNNPALVGTVIMQHHERPDGTGFPEQTAYGQIHGLSAIFILAEELLHFCKDSSSVSIEQAKLFLKQLGPEFKKEPFLRVVEAMDQGLSKQT